MAIDIQHAVCMHCIILLSLSCLVLWFYGIFPPYGINGMIFGEKVIEHKMCVLIFSAALSKTFLILRRIWVRDILVNVQRSSHKVPVILVRS